MTPQSLRNWLNTHEKRLAETAKRNARCMRKCKSSYPELEKLTLQKVCEGIDTVTHLDSETITSFALKANIIPDENGNDCG